MDFAETIHLKGKVAIISGSSGDIGTAIALKFVQMGASISIHGLSEIKLGNLRRKCQDESAIKENPLVICGNILEESVRVQLVEETIRRYGKLDILVNISGYIEGNLLSTDTSTDLLDNVLDALIKVPFHLTKLAIPHLVRTHGNILYLSSAPDTHSVYASEYSIAKTGVDRLAELTAQELGPEKIRVNSIRSGSNIEDLSKPSTPKSGEATNIPDDEDIEKMRVKRLGNVEEIATMAVFLASEAASFVTGAIIPVDCEWRD